jgi:Subtilase family/Putative Ig domain/FlgD Ig-like domain
MSVRRWTTTTGLAALCGALAAGPAHAGWMWDRDQDKVDDRIQAVEAQGLPAAHVGNALSGKLRFAVMSAAAPFVYGVYVGYDHHPTDTDVAALAAVGVPIDVRYRYIDYVRTRLTAAQAHQIAALSGVTRVETIPMMYAVNDVATRTLRARDSGNQLFPSVWKELGVTGRGIVVAILDTGVNDEADPNTGYPGHESLRGKFLGGGSFYSGDPNLNTPIDGSENPKHQADPEVTYHGTHVAGTAIGTGGPQGIRNGAEPGFNAGLAPDARLVDCKVLSDAGVGFGASDALEWLIYHKSDSWGLAGADTVYRGIDVANMSLGGTDASDGTDADCAAVNAAHKAGIVVCVASGNDGNTHYMPSPAAADFALTVGAFTDDNTVNRADDYVADYSNEGPRDADSDADHVDEMKPNVMGSGTGINSALGDPTTAGNRYHHINGTSMATPTIVGVAALVRSANPTLSADQVREILMDTADHRRDRGQQPPSAADPFGVDPNYHPSWGWGQVDAYAAVKEAQNHSTTQVIRIQDIPQRGPDGFQVKWDTQREVGLARYELDRAPDQAGSPGAWTLIQTVPVANPSAQIHAVPNRHSYSYTDLDASLSASAYYWYRVRWVDVNGASHSEPPIRARITDSPVVARVRYSWTHDYSDGDLYVRFGTGTSTSSPAWFRQGLGAQSADSVVVRPGDTYLGTQQHYFHVDLTADDMVGGYLPPSAANPWFLSVKEGGYVNTKGTVNDFSVTVFGSGSTTYTAPNPATATVEKQETVFWIPLDPSTSVNHAPVLAPIGPRGVGEGLTLAFFVSASDADGGQTLTYAATGLPNGATFNAGTRQFSWTPGYGAMGSYTVHFTVHDNALPTQGQDFEDVTITVANRNPSDNDPPVLDPLTDRQGVVGEAMSFRVTGHDPEGAALTYSATGLPSGAALDPSTGLFSWTPDVPAVGLHPVTFHATDPAGAHADQSMYLVISDRGAAAPPPLPCNGQSSMQNGTVDSGIDPVTVSYSYQPLVLGRNTESVTGTLSWFGGPSRDLDFTLLDSDSNVVGGSASASNPEIIRIGALPPGTYYWRVTAFTNPDTCHYSIQTDLCVAPITVGVGESPMLSFAMSTPVPNPFRHATVIAFALPRGGDTSLRLYDVAGRLVRTLQNGPLAPGRHLRVWDGRTDAGGRAAPGVYFSRLESGAKVLSKKVIMLN